MSTADPMGEEFEAWFDIELEDAIDAAFGMINRRKFDKEMGIISVVRLEMRHNRLGWAWLGEEPLAARAGMSRSTFRVRCAEPTDKHPESGRMWRIQWILERGPVGAGQRGTAWRVRHPSRWRGVPWTETNKELRDYRLGFPTHDENETADDQQPSDEGIARLTDVAARREDRAATPATRAEMEALAARSTNRAAARKRAARKAAEIARQRDANVPPPPSGRRRAERSSSWGGDEEEEEQGAAHEVIAAIEAKTGRLVEANSLKARLGRLVDRHPPADLVAMVAKAPDDYMPPMVVKWLEKAAKGGHVGATVDPNRLELDRLRGEIARYERAGDDPPEELTVALLACENRLRHREEPDT